MAQENEVDLPSEESTVQERIEALYSKDLSTDEAEEQPAELDEELPEEDSESEEEAPSPFVEVEFEGKAYQVPQEIKDALISKADYTQGKQQLARNREALELQQAQLKEVFETQQFEETVKPIINEVSILKYQLDQYKGLNWSEMGDSEIMRRRMEQDQIKEAIAEREKIVGDKRNQFKQEQEARLQEVLGKASEQLGKLIPNWNEKVASDLSEYALSQGYTSTEVQHITNPRDVSVLWKAKQYDDLVATKKEALKKASKAPPVVKPGSVKRMPKDVRNKLEFKKAMKKAKTGNASEGEQARLIRQQLERRFGG